jgi:hypothetical protein
MTTFYAFFSQHPSVIRNVMFHCRWVLDQRGIPVEDQPTGFGPPGPPGDMVVTRNKNLTSKNDEFNHTYNMFEL